MTHVLSYPHYSPSKRDLRGYLLFYDRLSTIVPYVDQPGIEDREEWRELSEISMGEALGLISPSYEHMSWFNQTSSRKTFKKLAKEIRHTDNFRELNAKIRTNEDGVLIQGQNRDAEKYLKNLGWNYLASQKFPYDMLQDLKRKKLAFVTDPIDPEQNPILIEPQLGNFLLSRLARKIAEDEDLAPVSSNKRQVDNLLLDGKVTRRNRRSELLAISLDVALPEDIGGLRIGDFWEIRNEFSEARAEMGSMMDGLAVNLDLDSEKDILVFRQKVEDKRSDIQQRVRQAQKTTRNKNTVTLAIDIIVGATTSGLGAFIGGVKGAVLGAGIAPVVSNYGKKISLRHFNEDIDAINKLAAMRTKFIRQSRVERYERPFYYL